MVKQQKKLQEKALKKEKLIKTLVAELKSDNGGRRPIKEPREAWSQIDPDGVKNPGVVYFGSIPVGVDCKMVITLLLIFGLKRPNQWP